MKNLVYFLLIWLVLGCQQSRTSTILESEIIEQVTNSDSTSEKKAELKDKEERFYENMIGKDFAASSFSTIEGEELSSSYLRGKVVFMNFWYKNCSPCMAEMEGLEFLHEKYVGENCVFIMVTFEDLEVIEEIQNEYDLQYKMVSVDKASISSWGIRGYPSSFVLDLTGKVVYARAGGQDVVQKATVEVLSHFSPKIEAQLESLN